ncbi:putative Transcriptional regulator, LuxR family [Bradyrhizobium sp. STM 3809]|nr:putative Transcriptional regulator, LuxR family [Bradyrhizobium sp. STM 3809]
MPTDTEQLSELIAAIYDTAFDPDRWPDALARTTQFMDATGATFAAHDAARKEGNPYYTHGGDPALNARYYTETVRFNPALVPISLYREPGEVFHLTELVANDELRRSRLFKDWMEPSDWGDFTHALIEKSGTRFSTFGVAHPLSRSPADEQVKARLGLLVPHVLRAVQISNSMQLQRVELDAMTVALEALSAAVFLLRVEADYVYANPAALQLLADGRLVAETDGRLRPIDADAAKLLREALQASTDLALAAQPVSIILGRHGDETWVGHVVSLKQGARRRAGRHYDVVAALFVHRAEARRPTLVQVIAAQFKLTAAEARVLFAILTADGVAETAAILGIAEETVKTHLKRIYAKTNTSGQAELFKLLLAYANPMVG